MRFGSLFAGIGGMDLGLERAGMEIRWMVEIDDYCTQVLEKHWPDVPKYRDVRDVGAHSLEAVDLIAGGFPCQDLSAAGRMAGLEGERSGLWREFLRVTAELRPDGCLVENVQHTWRRWVPVVRRELGRLGFWSAPLQLSAAEVGADHIRRRAFVFAHTDREFLRELAWRWSRPNREVETQPLDSRWGRAASRVARSHDGVPHALDRNAALGNAVVPQVAELIGRRILEAHGTLT